MGAPSAVRQGDRRRRRGSTRLRQEGYFFKDDRYVGYDFTGNGGKGKILRRTGLTWLLATIALAVGCSRDGSAPLAERLRAKELPYAGGADRTAEPEPEGARGTTNLCPTVITHLVRMENIAPKHRARQRDAHAAAIVSLGKAAGPCLVEKLTDMTRSLTVYLYPYTVGELALYLLDEIYLPQHMPFPDQPPPEGVETGYDYHKFLASPDVRTRLQEHWRAYVAAHRE